MRNLRRTPYRLSPKRFWIIASSVPARRRRALTGSASFSSIVSELRPKEILDFDVVEMRERAGFVRCELVFSCSPTAADQWHNSRGGIRALYCLDPKLGEIAEQYAISRLWPQIERLRTLHPKFCGYASHLVRASLLDMFSKICIARGRWMVFSRIADRQLLVPEWVSVWQSRSPPYTKAQLRARKLARWGALLPKETRIQIKGGWIHRTTARSLGRRAADKEDRSDELHHYGFT